MLGSSNNDAANDMISAYEQASSAKFGLNSAVEIGIVINDKWRFKSGLIFADKGEQVNAMLFTTSSFAPYIVSTGTSINAVVSSPGNGGVDNIFENSKDNSGYQPASNPGSNSQTIIVYTESESEGFGGQHVTINSKYSFYDIPFLMEYNFSKGKLKYYLTGGLSANIFRSNTLITKFNDSNEKMVRAGSDAPFRKVSSSFIFGGGLEIPLLPKVGLSFEPNLRYNFISITKKNYIKGHPFAYGITTGIRYHL